MLDKKEHEKAAKMLNFLCFYLKEQEQVKEPEIIVALLYSVAIQSHNAKIKESNLHKTLSGIISEVKTKLAIMHLSSDKIPEA